MVADKGVVVDAIASANDKIMVRPRPPGKIRARRKMPVAFKESVGDTHLRRRDPEVRRCRPKILGHRLLREIYFAIAVEARDGLSRGQVEARSVACFERSLPPALISDAVRNGEVRRYLPGVLRIQAGVRRVVESERRKRVVTVGTGRQPQ